MSEFKIFFSWQSDLSSNKTTRFIDECLTEVESILLAIDGIQQVIVYGKVNSVLGNILCADIKLEKGIQLTDMEIKRIVSSQLQDFKIPRRIKFVENMQLTRTGKLKRS